MQNDNGQREDNMASTAFALCEENNLPIYVFDMNKKGNLLRVVKGEAIGTEVAAE